MNKTVILFLKEEKAMHLKQQTVLYACSIDAVPLE